MKRNKKIAKGMRSGKSPYKRHRKSPCLHCQDLTRAAIDRAGRGMGTTFDNAAIAAQATSGAILRDLRAGE